MRIIKNHPLLKLINSYLIDSPQPSNISYLWNFGSLLGLCLVVQIITGVTLAMHYNTGIFEAFNSVEHIMRDVNNGWLLRYLHSNTASAFFFLVYLHIGRGLYYGSYKVPRTLVWTIGTVIFILLMAIAFLGYVLPYGQMSLWGFYFKPQMYSFLFFFYCLTLICLILISPINVNTYTSPADTNLLRTRGIDRIGPDNKDVLSVIFGSLLGDAHGEKRVKGKGTRFTFNQESSHVEYIFFLHKFFSSRGYCNTKTPVIATRLGVKGKVRKIVRFSTWTYTSFNWIHGIWYKGNKKTVPLCIGEYLTPLALAIWIMDDGCKIGKALKFSTNSFTYDECLLLVNVLKDNFNIKSTIQQTGVNNQYIIYIWKQSMQDLINTVSPYLVPEMKYKINCLQSYLIPLTTNHIYNTLNYITSVIGKLNKNIFYFIITLIALFILALSFYYIFDIEPIYCIDDETENKLSAAKELTKNINPTVSGNNINIDVKNPNLHLHNPNITIPGSLGTSIGIGGSVSAGIYALSRSKGMGAMPVGSKAATFALGGIMGGGAFVAANYMNRYAQKGLNNSTDSNKKNGPFSSASSIIEEGDSVDTVIYYLNLNLTISFIILCLSLLLVYLYVYKISKPKTLYKIYMLLVIITLFSIYLSYNLIEDIDIVSSIYQNIAYSKYNCNIYNNSSEAKETIEFLMINMLFKCCILLSLYLLLMLHINTKIVNESWQFKFIKDILGEYYHSLFIKLLKFTSNSNKVWMIVLSILLIIACLVSIIIALFIINYMDIITETYVNSRFGSST